ncbi:MAG: ferrous iron transporter B [Planctomycetota bacterium]
MSIDTAATGASAASRATLQFALLGNPNAGKTTLFNRLCGVRAHTSNYPGTTVEARVGHVDLGDIQLGVVDLPGVYRLALDVPEARFCRDYLAGRVGTLSPPAAALVIVDSTNLRRHLLLAGEVLARGLPAVVALNMSDQRRRAGIRIDIPRLERHLGCRVVEICARSGEGMAQLRQALKDPVLPTTSPPEHPVAVEAWAARVVDDCVAEPGEAQTERADRWDRLLTHSVLGPVIFALVMGLLFWTIFALADRPMSWIETAFEVLGGWVSAWLPEGAIRGLAVDGVIAGIAGTVVFLPQICLLFFLLTMLEDTGYLARAAFVVDRFMRRFGLPGQAFVPLLSSHACALPGIACARLVPDRRDRLATILVAPFMSCSARLPVYVLLTGLLFHDRPLLAAIAFAGCYALGASAALVTARLVRHTILRGPSPAMVLELPVYRRPSVRNALMASLERGLSFLRKAGTVILGICIVLWWLSAYPSLAVPPREVDELRVRAEALAETDPQRAELLDQASRLEGKAALAHSFAGRLGKTCEPVFAPLGFDWQISIAVIASFAAREVFVSTLAVMFQSSEEEPEKIRDLVRDQRRADGSRLFATATCASLLVFYVLALQCLPTLAVTRREAGGWHWALLQLAYMTALAYLFALGTYWAVSAWAAS